MMCLLNEIKILICRLAKKDLAIKICLNCITHPSLFLEDMKGMKLFQHTFIRGETEPEPVLHPVDNLKLTDKYILCTSIHFYKSR